MMSAEDVIRLMSECKGINIAGDFVMNKTVHVTYEIGSVEAGGIGVRVTGDGELMRHGGLPSGGSVPQVSCVPPDVLRSPDAMRLWAVAKAQGWVDEDLQPLVSMNKAAILASVMADALGLSPRWKAFEELWGKYDWANKLTAAMNCKYYPDTLKEYAERLK